MSEITALEKHACAACGAQAEWNPSKQKLVCPFCGTEAPYAVDAATGAIQEIDLVRTLREMPEDLRGWQADTKSVQCRSCRAVMVFDATKVGQNCEFCGSPALVDYQEIKAPIRPQSLLPFKVSEPQVREQHQEVVREQVVRAEPLQGQGARRHGPRPLRARTGRSTRRSHCPWWAEAGHYYYTTETYRDSNGRTPDPAGAARALGARVRRRRSLLRRRAGARHQGVDLNLLREVEPFPTTDLVPYDTAFLSGFVVEHYQVVLIDAAKRSQDQMHGKLESLCAAQVPGDTHRNLRIAPEYSGQTFKHVLVPVWLLGYTYGAKRFQVVVNGYTGAIAGDYPKSPWKILFVVVLILVILLLVLYTQ